MESKKAEDWQSMDLKDRISHQIIKGITTNIEEDVEEARGLYDSPLEIIEGPFNGWHEACWRPLWRRKKCFFLKLLKALEL